MVIMEMTRGGWILNVLKIEPIGLANLLNARCGEGKLSRMSLRHFVSAVEKWSE